jgi:hypothetical protein
VEWLLKGEFDTSELVVTCLKLELVLRGEALISPFGLGDVSLGFGEGLSGEVREVESRLFICKGDHPFAEEEMIEFRAVSLPGEGWNRSRLVCGEADITDLVVSVTSILYPDRR